jgi:hypothetical protein
LAIAILMFFLRSVFSTPLCNCIRGFCRRFGLKDKQPRRVGLRSGSFGLLQRPLRGNVLHCQMSDTAHPKSFCASNSCVCKSPDRPQCSRSPSGLTLISFASAAKVGNEPEADFVIAPFEILACASSWVLAIPVGFECYPLG